MKHANLPAIRVVHFTKENYRNILPDPIVNKLVLRTSGSDRRGFHLIGLVTVDGFVAIEQPVSEIIEDALRNVLVRKVAADKTRGTLLRGHAADPVSRGSIEKL